MAAVANSLAMSGFAVLSYSRNNSHCVKQRNTISVHQALLHNFGIFVILALAVMDVAKIPTADH